jgi:hypothetical protein
LVKIHAGIDGFVDRIKAEARRRFRRGRCLAEAANNQTEQQSWRKIKYSHEIPPFDDDLDFKLGHSVGARSAKIAWLTDSHKNDSHKNDLHKLDADKTDLHETFLLFKMKLVLPVSAIFSNNLSNNLASRKH